MCNLGLRPRFLATASFNICVAYAYFMYEPDKVLTEVSEKRLEAIKDFTELGSGFKSTNSVLALGMSTPVSMIVVVTNTSYWPAIVLSRFSTKKQVDETLAKLKSGECDAVVGTHRLL